jgi:CRP-like cAMP-binding protein/membrane protein YdbS with pleckstrin-like domain
MMTQSAASGQHETQGDTMDNSTLEDRLSRFGLFEGFAQAELQQICGFVKEKTFRSGRILFHQGDLPDTFFLVENGSVRETGRNDNDDVVLRRTVDQHGYLGHRALMEARAHETTAIAAENCLLLTIKADDFRTLLAMFPRLRERLRRVRVINRLMAIPLFGGFSLEQLTYVADLAEVVEVPAGQTVFAQGEESDAFYVIDSGQVRQTAMGGAPGTQTWPKYFTAGGFFGRHGLLHAQARRANAEAVTDLNLFRFNADAFHWLCDIEPEFKRALKRQDVLGHLRDTKLFTQLSDTDLKQLSGYVGLAHYRPGDVLYRQGEVDPTLYMLYEGEAIVRALDTEGRERPRDYLEPGNAVGQTSVFLREPRDVTLEATTKSNWLYLTRDDLDRFLSIRPDLSSRLAPRREIRRRRRLKPPKWMDPDEQIILRQRRHWYFLLGRILGPVLLLFAALFLWLALKELAFLSWSLVVIGTLWMTWRFIDWINDYYVLSTQRVIHQERVLAIRQSRDETPLDKIQNVNISQGFQGNLFGFGKLVIDTAAASGVTRVTFDHIGAPEVMEKKIFEQVERARAGQRLQTRRSIRDKLESRVGEGIRPFVPKPAVPDDGPVVQEAAKPEIGLWDAIGNATWRKQFWIVRRSDDRVVWRKHWIRLIRKTWLSGPFLILMLIVFGWYLFSVENKVALLTMLLWALLLGAIFWFWWNWENWGNDRYIVTRDRIIDIEAWPFGFRTLKTETMFDRIQNVSFEVPNPIATVLNYGTVLIYTAGAEGRLDFEWVPNPSGVQSEIFRRLSEHEEGQRLRDVEERWADLPEWFAAYEERRSV